MPALRAACPGMTQPWVLESCLGALWWGWWWWWWWWAQLRCKSLILSLKTGRNLPRELQPLAPHGLIVHWMLWEWKEKITKKMRGFGRDTGSHPLALLLTPWEMVSLRAAGGWGSSLNLRRYFQLFFWVDWVVASQFALQTFTLLLHISQFLLTHIVWDEIKYFQPH